MAAVRFARLTAVLGLAVLGIALSPAPVRAGLCPFCTEEKGPTLVGDFNQATIVLVGTFSDPRRAGGKGDLESGTTKFTIEQCLKGADQPFVKGKSVIIVPRYLPPTQSKFVIFCDVYQGNIDPYRGVELVKNSNLVEYLMKSLALKDQPIGKRLRHCFDYLDSVDPDVALDAYREFARADYIDYRDMAKSLPADKVAGWLQDPKTPPYRYGLYASLLGLCGDSKKHGDLLRSMVDDPKKRTGSGLEGLMAGMLMLQPKEGWVYLENLLKDEKEEFLVRYAGLTTLRFFWSSRPDVFPKEQLARGACLTLVHSDMADFAIEDLRKWHQWELTPRVLALFDEDSHNLPVVKRAILRFALQADKQGNNKDARAFVAAQTKLNEEWVNDTWELLRIDLEATPQATPTEEKK